MKDLNLSKELQDYRAIGSLEYFKILKQLDTPQKVNISVHPVYGSKAYYCPNCAANLTGMGFDVCVDCRQKLDWSE